MIKTYILSFLVAVTLVLTACAITGTTKSDLNGTAWILTRLNGQPILDGTEPSLTFSDGQASGNGSCNSFGGEYTQKGSGLQFGALMSTEMACYPFKIMDQEQAYYAALGSTTSYLLNGDRLTLTDAEGNSLLEFIYKSQ